jgi:hypothetical protein
MEKLPSCVLRNGSSSLESLVPGIDGKLWIAKHWMSSRQVKVMPNGPGTVNDTRNERMSKMLQVAWALFQAPVMGV